MGKFCVLLIFYCLFKVGFLKEKKRKERKGKERKGKEMIYYKAYVIVGDDGFLAD